MPVPSAMGIDILKGVALPASVTACATIGYETRRQGRCRIFQGAATSQMVTAQDDTRVSSQFDVAFRNHKKGPGGRGAAGQSGRKRPTWAPDGDATNNGRPMLTLSDRVEGPAARRRISMHRKPTHPDAQGIADDGRDENGEHQRPAAKVAIEVHR